jgi:hypothetical protein
MGMVLVDQASEQSVVVSTIPDQLTNALHDFLSCANSSFCLNEKE